MELIDKAVLLNRIATEVHYDSEHSLEMYAKMLSLINDAPDGVVRCKDCKHWHESIFLRGEQGQRVGLCDCTMSMRDTDFFCKAGEKERRCQN